MTNGHEQGGQPPQEPPGGSQPEPYQPPDQSQGYPPPGQGYPPPPQQGYPPQGGYPPPQQGYPPPPQGYPPQGGYPPPQGYPPQQAPNNTLAIVSLVAGIAGLTVLFGVASIVAVVTGHIAKRQIRDSQGREGGDGMATAGLVTGYLGVAVGLFFLIVFVILLGVFAENAPEIIDELEDLTTPSPLPS